jgi:hypothetical protein
MSKRWRLAGLLLAVAVFSYTLLTGENPWPVPDGLPIVVSALYGAAATFFVVWLYEAIVIAVRWVLRRFLPAPRPSDRGD